MAKLSTYFVVRSLGIPLSRCTRWILAQVTDFGWYGVVTVIGLAFLWRGGNGMHSGVGDILVGGLILVFVVRAARRE